MNTFQALSPKPTLTTVGRRRFAFSRSRAESVGHRPVGLRLGAGTDPFDATIVPTKLSKNAIGRTVWPDLTGPNPFGMDRIRIRLSAASPSQDNGSDNRAENLTGVTRPRQLACGFFLRRLFSDPSEPGVEKTGFEPATPCLQSRCSTD